MIHGAIGEFTKTFADNADDPVGELTDIGARHFQPLEDFPEARAFWWPRFLRIAAGSPRCETARRASSRRSRRRSAASIQIPLGDGEFKLHGRADRIERLPDGRYAILDYKTGAGADREAGPHRACRRSSRSKPRSCARAASPIPAGASVADLLYVGLRGGAGRRGSADRVRGRHRRRAGRQRAGAVRRTARHSPIPTRPIGRWCIRCGRRTTALTITWRASRNGRWSATTRKTKAAKSAQGRAHDEQLSKPRIIPPAVLERRSTPPTRSARPGSRPMPAPARPMCWRSA